MEGYFSHKHKAWRPLQRGWVWDLRGCWGCQFWAWGCCSWPWLAQILWWDCGLKSKGWYFENVWRKQKSLLTAWRPWWDKKLRARLSLIDHKRLFLPFFQIKMKTETERRRGLEKNSKSFSVKEIKVWIWGSFSQKKSGPSPECVRKDKL